jgi:hypothetical protein
MTERYRVCYAANTRPAARKTQRPRHGSTDAFMTERTNHPCRPGQPLDECPDTRMRALLPLAWRQSLAVSGVGQRRWGKPHHVVGPDVRTEIATLGSGEADALVFQEGALDARMSERPAAAQVPARADDAMRRYVFRAVVHRPADLPGASHAAQQP